MIFRNSRGRFEIRKRCGFLLAVVSAAVFLLASCHKPESDSALEIFQAGARVPAFQLARLDGSAAGAGIFAGKTTLLNFWATWCTTCVAEMPALERLHLKLQDQGFQVVGISVDAADKTAEVEEFVRRNSITFPVLRDPGFSTPRRFATTGFPESFFIDASGRFLSFADPLAHQAGVRVISDRPWDSEDYINAVRKLLPPK